MRHPYGETITIERQGVPTGGKDQQGNPLRAAGVTITVRSVAVAPLDGNEVQDGGSRLSNAYSLYLPFGTDIRSTDLVTVRGVSGWHVDSDAGQVDWSSPFSPWQPGTVAVVRRDS